MNRFLKLHLKKALNVPSAQLEELFADPTALGAKLASIDPKDLGSLIGNMHEVLEFNEANSARHIRSLQVKVEEAELIRELQDAHAKLGLAKERAEEASRAKDEFLAGMSHELRTPLNAVLGIAEALQDGLYGEVTERQIEAAQRIEDGGRHLLELIGDILDIAKIEAGEMSLEIEPVNVRQVCEKSIAFLRETAAKKSISITLQIQRGTEIVMADERRLKQMIVNLLSNSVKFTEPRGSIGVTVSSDIHTGQIRFCVKDSGIGISEDNIQLLFRPFVQLDSALSRQYEGAGLGLSLVINMADMHGGRVDVESEVGVGSQFSIILPYEENEFEDIPIETLLITPTEDPESTEPMADYGSALLVEDTQTDVDRIGRFLSELSISAAICMRGEEVVRMALKKKPDVIILDIFLPDMIGWDALDALKAHPETKAIPVLILSIMDDRTRGLQRGAAEYLVKPIRRSDLRAALNKISSKTCEAVILEEYIPKGESDALRSVTLQQPTILIAEDNDANIVTTREYLERIGFLIERAHDGREAVQMMTSKRPDLVLMDIQMPGMDGLEATRAIRQDPVSANVPIIAVTALAMPGDRARFLEAGMDDYLSKPYRLKELRQLIMNHLQIPEPA